MPKYIKFRHSSPLQAANKIDHTVTDRQNTQQYNSPLNKKET